MHLHLFGHFQIIFEHFETINLDFLKVHVLGHDSKAYDAGDGYGMLRIKK